MIQAYTLMSLDWKPSTWSDVGSMPHVVVGYLFAMRAGQAAPPFGWFRTGAIGIATLATCSASAPTAPSSWRAAVLRQNLEPSTAQTARHPCASAARPSQAGARCPSAPSATWTKS